MQYWRPAEDHFVGDCMPFWHDGVFHLYYLVDEGHHRARGGLGGHQWAHTSTRDLRTWEHHPLALAVEEEWEGSICTGSVFWHEGTYHAFYATRKPDWTQHLCHAVSVDGIHFTKDSPIPLIPLADGFDPLHFRDPFVFADSAGLFHMLVTARMTDYPLTDGGGCLLHLTSADLHSWRVVGPMLVPGGREVPECADCFEWSGWWYLVFGMGLRTVYRMARNPAGPWQRPAIELLDSPLAAVMKTAPFGPNRRIGAAWVGTRLDDRDSGGIQWGGNLLLRELVQHDDGTLSTGFVPEQMPHGRPHDAQWTGLTDGVSVSSERATLRAAGRPAIATLSRIPQNFYLRCQVTSQAGYGANGLILRAGNGRADGYDLRFDPGLRRVTLADQGIDGVDRLNGTFLLEIIATGDIIDVCIGGRRCLVNRLPERTGDAIILYREEGELAFSELAVHAL